MLLSDSWILYEYVLIQFMGFIYGYIKTLKGKLHAN